MLIDYVLLLEYVYTDGLIMLTVLYYWIVIPTDIYIYTVSIFDPFFYK